MSFSGEMDKQTTVHLYNTQPSEKRRTIDTGNNLDKLQKQIERS